MATRTILLVEDNRMVADLIQRVLQTGEYEVLTAQSGAEGLALCREHPGEIELLLCDVVLPDFPGVNVAHAALQCHPRIKALFTSGYPLEVLFGRGLLSREILQDGMAPFIQKPFLPNELLALVERVLATRPEAAAAVKSQPGATCVCAAY